MSDDTRYNGVGNNGVGMQEKYYIKDRNGRKREVSKAEYLEYEAQRAIDSFQSGRHEDTAMDFDITKEIPPGITLGPADDPSLTPRRGWCTIKGRTDYGSDEPGYDPLDYLTKQQI